MNNLSNIFERIMQIIEYYNIKSVNSFAKDYLGYNSSEKINRLKDQKKKPSIEILEDISNKFEEINPEWLLLGKGEMLRNSSENTNVGSGVLVNASTTGNIANGNQGEAIEVLREQLNAKDAQIKELIDVIKSLSGVKKL